ncbi:hypothetical protein [Arcobacter roscoffensis]|uniref:Antitoxin n=1 Tax=Arcobacter roscoffensis TaxID=2961520 RepID=A0ABY5E359_9BACT|nr:hypothetical protein [Arcobacter roscoffensis]UTJ06599.1 hypothetical protein NJU99_00475 [Arcobacter roscoffensis]
MNLLQYTSKEMFSSTELIRKSKMVFDKLSDEEIEKAVILRDGKPSFMLLDFDRYESIIEEYEKLKKENKKLKEKKKTTELRTEQNTSSEPTVLKQPKEDAISSDELENALAQIEQLDISLDKKNESIKKQEALKDFWE